MECLAVMSSRTTISRLLRAGGIVCILLISFSVSFIAHVLFLDCELLMMSLPSVLMIIGKGCGSLGQYHIFCARAVPGRALKNCLFIAMFTANVTFIK